MATDAESIAASIRDAVKPGFRNDLLAKGQARSMIWREGELPADAPSFSALLSYDLLSYAYSLISKGLRLLDLREEMDSARSAFENAASAIEAVVARGRSGQERDFHRLIAGACYHLAGYAARAFSLLRNGLDDANLALPERALAMLMLRDLDGLIHLIGNVRLSERASDEAMINVLVQHDPTSAAIFEGAPEYDERLIEVVNSALTDNFMAAVGTAMLAFERGERELLSASIERLHVGRTSAGELNLVSQWWCHRFTEQLLDDLWSSSFHERLPVAPPGDGLAAWSSLRALFIATLYRRGRSEIDLWPSQVEAASRCLKLSENLVLSLPTSAGKTRIAELCILACLAEGRRVVFVTPLRALSAQTEVTLQRTFGPLGKTVSSLYGAIGVGDVDGDLLRHSDIIVATPEKLDFALRSDPTLFDDVGLIVLDEGHMIGISEREVRYEVQIQRLLRRDDAAGRRIVCLSAILPDGDQLEDFTAWLSGDQEGALIKKDWRPTRLRFGEVEWRGDHAQLNISVGAQQPWIGSFLKSSLPKGRLSRLFPNDQRELCIATAWKLVEEGHSVLIFCPLRVSVEPFAERIVDLARRGTLSSVLAEDSTRLDDALAIGGEWLGPDSAVLECLRLGVAIHHAALPTQFRKEIEKLLRDGVLRITVSSPTLAQGLNLSATTLIFHGLNRNRTPIEIAEFRNVVGRAGRAYVDMEGLVLFPMFKDIPAQRAAWKEIVDSTKGKEMESGLLRLLLSLIRRMVKKHKLRSADGLVDYLAGNAAWGFPELNEERPHVANVERARWSELLITLDTALLSMLGEHDVPEESIEEALDDILAASLLMRRMSRHPPELGPALLAGLYARARYIWGRTTAAQRRGYFLAGVGLATGEALDAASPLLNELLARANGAILAKDDEAAISAVEAFAEIVFAIEPFEVKDPPDDWRAVLGAWLNGGALASSAAERESKILQFVEKDIIYRLSWAMEAVRVRAIANGDRTSNGFAMTDLELGVAVAAVETGTLNQAAATLIRAGFGSRTAAIVAVTEASGTFTTLGGLRKWVREKHVASRESDPSWPTTSSHGLWTQFIAGFSSAGPPSWGRRTARFAVRWRVEHLSPGTPVRLFDDESGTAVLGSDFTPLGRLEVAIRPQRAGLLKATVASDSGYLDVSYIGPNDLLRG